MNVKKALLIGFILIFVLGACTPSPDDEVADEDAVSEEQAADSADGVEETSEPEVTLLFAVNGWERGRYENIIELFEEDNPQIKVELITTDELMGDRRIYSEDIDQNEAMLKLAQGADVFNTFFDPSMLSEGFFLDMAPLLDGDPDFNREDFFPGILDQYTQDGKVYGIPTRSSYALVFYNKTLFDEAGLDYPEAGWTWDDMLANAQALTKRSGDEVTQWGVVMQNFGHLSVILSQGVEPYVQNGPIFEPRFDDPEVQAGIENYLSWFVDEEVTPIETFDEESGQLLLSGVPSDIGSYGLIENGQVGMWLEFSDAWQYRSEQEGLELGVVPYPANNQTENTTPSLPGGSIFMISAGTAKADAAWELIRYLSDNTNETSMPYEEAALPARRSVAEATGYWDSVDPELAEALRYAADHSFGAPIFSPMMGSLENAIYQVLGEGVPLEEALGQAQEEAEKMITEQEDALAETEPVPEFSVNEPEPVAEGTVTISFVVGGGDPFLFREAADRFNEENPDIVVKIREPNYFQPDDFSLSTMLSDADCFQWWGSLNAEEDLALILSPQPFLDADPELSQEDFFSATLSQMTVQGQLLGIPHEVQVTLMNYNKELFDEAGRPYPQAGWTMDDFLETAVAMTQGEDEATKIWGFVGNPYEFGDFMTFAERQGADFFDLQSDPPRATFDTPEVIEAISWYVDLSTEYGVKPTFDVNAFNGPIYNEEDDPWFQRQALIENRRGAIWTGDMFGFVSYSPEGEPVETDTDWIGYVPYPVGDEGGVGFDNVTGLYIMASSQQRQACWDWIKFISSEPSLITFGLPANVTAANSPEIAEQHSADRVAVLIDSVENSVRGSDQNIFNSENGWIGMSFNWLDRGYQEVISGDKTVEQALAEAQTKADDFAACMVAEDDFSNYETSEKCAQEADPNWGQQFP